MLKNTIFRQKNYRKKFKIKFNYRNILIGVHPEIDFKVTNLKVLERFIIQYQMMKRTISLLPCLQLIITA